MVSQSIFPPEEVDLLAKSKIVHHKIGLGREDGRKPETRTLRASMRISYL